jgi:hypothetical protein
MKAICGAPSAWIVINHLKTYLSEHLPEKIPSTSSAPQARRSSSSSCNLVRKVE